MKKETTANAENDEKVVKRAEAGKNEAAECGEEGNDGEDVEGGQDGDE